MNLLVLILQVDALTTTKLKWNTIKQTKHNTQSHYTSDEMQSIQLNITHNYIIFQMRCKQPNITHNHISSQMRCNQPNIIHNHITSHLRWDARSKHNTYSYLLLKMHEQWSHFVLNAHFVQDSRSKRNLIICRWCINEQR